MGTIYIYILMEYKREEKCDTHFKRRKVWHTTDPTVIGKLIADKRQYFDSFYYEFQI